MKKAILLLSLVIISACSSNDESNPSSNSNDLSSYVGKWKLTGKTNSTGNNIAVNDCENLYNWVQINSDGASIISKYNMYSVGGSNYCNQFTGNFNCVLNSNFLTFKTINTTGIVSELKYEVMNLNSLTLMMKKISIKNGDIDTPTPINQQVTEIFTKI